MSGKNKWSSVVAGIVLAGSGFAQGITVNVDGQPVSFPGVGPQQINGRVMVPLRGVMEKLGAYVGYDPATRSVTATRGDIDLQLKLGQRVAKLNGREVMLDVPAMEYHGSTLVPLRFMGEALGAQVRWDGAAQSVNILTSTTGGRPEPVENPPVGAGPVEIRSFTSDREGFLRAGNIVTYTLEGTPGSVATLQIPGVTEEVRMTEVSPGKYQAQITVPNQGLAVNRANAMARLRSGNSERLIQAGNTISVDTEPPQILDFAPSSDLRTSSRQPNITAVLQDTGSGIATDRVQISVDGRNVTRDATVNPTFIAYRPASPLAPGRHEVEISAEDMAGNQVRRNWSFNIGNRSNVIRSFTSNAGANPQPGQVVHFTLLGESGGQATLDLGNGRTPIRMRETSPGRYEADYTMRRADDFEGMRIVGTLRTSDNETYTTDPGTDPLSSRDRAVRKPTITSPLEDATVSDQFRVTGTGPRQGRVRIKVDYKTSLLGLLNSGGTLTEQVVDVDANGRYSSDPIRLGGFANGRGTTYTITVVAINRNGKESDPVTITTRR